MPNPPQSDSARPVIYRGRGKNPASSGNLIAGGDTRKWWVFVRDTFKGEWQPMFGPFHYKTALTGAYRLNVAAGSNDYATVQAHSDQ